MICQNCQKTITDDSKFCEYCGSSTAEIITEEKPDNDKNQNNDSASMLLAGKMENELLHIKNDITSIKVNRLITIISTGIFITLEIITYLVFTAVIVSLISSFFVSRAKVIELIPFINGNEISFNQSNNIFTVLNIVKVIIFLISLLILACGIFFTAIRRQSIKVLRQDSIIKKIVASINNLINDLKKN